MAVGAVPLYQMWLRGFEKYNQLEKFDFLHQVILQPTAEAVGFDF